MRILRKFNIASVCSLVLSMILYSCILFQSFGLLEFQSTLFLLYFAEAFLLLAFVFFISVILNNKTTIDTVKIKRVCIVVVTVILIGSIILCSYAYLDCYNYYTPKILFENDVEKIQPFYPYHNVEAYSKSNKDPIELSVSHIPGTEYIYLYCYGDYFSDTNYDYELEYVKSVSPFMKNKFLAERIIPTQFNEMEIDVLKYGKKMKIDGINFISYVDKNNYAVLFNFFDECIYASLVDAPESITIEDFAREIIKQSDLLDNATKERAFLDVPIAETWAELF